MRREDESPDLSDGFEDSDCEGGPEPAGGPVPEDQVDGKEEREGCFPVLTMGSFARYAQHLVVARLELLTLPTVGDHYFSICIRTRYSLHHLNLKVSTCVHNTYRSGRRQTSLLPVHPKRSTPLLPR